MISAILPFVLSVVTAATPTLAPADSAAARDAEPAIKVTLNHQTYNRGDRARVTVRVRDDGYVVVLHEDANGHVRVLFPVDPGDDAFLKAGQDYEIRARGDRDAFQVTGTGSGTVYAAVQMDPYHFDDFVRNTHWDYARLDDDSAATNDPEALMTNLVEQMADGNHFDYDVATYTAEAPYASNGGHAYIVPSATYGCFYGGWDPWCDGYYPSPTYYGGFGFDVGFGFGGFWGYRPYGYGYGYGYPYGYGYGYGYPIYGHGYGHGYGAAGYGYSMGHGFSYNRNPIHLGAGGSYTLGRGSSAWGLGSTVGYRNRGSLVSTRGSSPLYGVSKFNTQRSPSRGIDSPNRYGRREMPSDAQGSFRTRINDNNTRPATRSTSGEGQSHVDGPSSRPTRAEPRVESRPTRAEPRAEPRSQPRSEPRSEGRSRPPESHGGGGHAEGGGRRGGGGGGGGGGHSGGHGGGRRP
jgi:uncharacterized protein DUF4384